MSGTPMEIATLQLAILKDMADTEPERVLRICCSIDNIKERLLEQDTGRVEKDFNQVIEEIRQQASDNITNKPKLPGDRP